MPVSFWNEKCKILRMQITPPGGCQTFSYITIWVSFHSSFYKYIVFCFKSFHKNVTYNGCHVITWYGNFTKFFLRNLPYFVSKLFYTRNPHRCQCCHATTNRKCIYPSKTTLFLSIVCSCKILNQQLQFCHHLDVAKGGGRECNARPTCEKKTAFPTTRGEIWKFKSDSRNTVSFFPFFSMNEKIEWVSTECIINVNFSNWFNRERCVISYECGCVCVRLWSCRPWGHDAFARISKGIVIRTTPCLSWPL
jgi:hypothetical protein